MEITFGEAGTGSDSPLLFSLLRQAALQHDNEAPLTLSGEEARMIEDRPEMQRLASEIADARAKHGTQSALVRRLSSHRVYLRRKYKFQEVEKKRKAYFAASDRLGALGGSESREDSVENDAVNAEAARNARFQKDMGGHGTKVISEFFHRDELGGDRRTLKTIQLLCEYMAHRFTNLDLMMIEIMAEVDGLPTSAIQPDANSERHRCLFGCMMTYSRYCLTKHFKTFHGPSFTTKFACPECWRLGKKPILITNATQYCLHAELAHGKKCAPQLDRSTEPNAPEFKQRTPKKYVRPDDVSCLLCPGVYAAGQGYSRHFNKTHRYSGFEAPFMCPTCVDNGITDEDVAGIDDLAAWRRHTETIHKVDSQRGHNIEVERMPRQVAEPGHSQGWSYDKEMITLSGSSPAPQILGSPTVAGAPTSVSWVGSASDLTKDSTSATTPRATSSVIHSFDSSSTAYSLAPLLPTGMIIDAQGNFNVVNSGPTPCPASDSSEDKMIKYDGSQPSYTQREDPPQPRHRPKLEP